MLFMHGRGGHGGHAHGSGPSENGLHSREARGSEHARHGCGHSGSESIDELRRRRGDLDREIREGEAAGARVESARR
jgi:hypothetical protein